MLFTFKDSNFQNVGNENERWNIQIVKQYVDKISLVSTFNAKEKVFFEPSEVKLTITRILWKTRILLLTLIFVYFNANILFLP